MNASGDLLFVELPRGCLSILRRGKRHTFADLGGSPNGAKLASDGSIFVANGGGCWPPVPATGMTCGLGRGTACLQRVTMEGKFETIITEIDGIELNSPNDLCFDKDGNLYFTDPNWPKRGARSIEPTSSAEAGSICFWSSDGRAHRVHTGLIFPNGVQLSASGTTLYVAETGTGNIHSFPVLEAGLLGEPQLFCKLGLESGVDGMCIDARNRLLVAGSGSGAIYIVGPEGNLEERLEFSDQCLTNLCFGIDDPHMLFVTAAISGTLIGTRLDTPGVPPPWA